MEQLTLTGETQETTLTERQQHALEAIEAADGGLASDELGAVMHERRGKHDRGVRCSWCQQEGQGVARELQKKRLVVRRRSGCWQSVRPLDKTAGTIGAGPAVLSSGLSGGGGEPVDRTDGRAQAEPIGHGAEESEGPGRVGAEARTAAGVSPPPESPRARASDPDTSQQAAASVQDLTGKQRAVLQVFEVAGPLTDEQLILLYNGTPQTDSGLRTRRHELVERGLVCDSGRKGVTAAGRASIIWEAVPEDIGF